MGCKSVREIAKEKVDASDIIAGSKFWKMIDSEDVDDKDDDSADKFVVSEAIKSASVKCNELYGDIPVF